MEARHRVFNADMLLRRHIGRTTRSRLMRAHGLRHARFFTQSRRQSALVTSRRVQRNSPSAHGAAAMRTPAPCLHCSALSPRGAPSRMARAVAGMLRRQFACPSCAVDSMVGMRRWCPQALLIGADLAQERPRARGRAREQCFARGSRPPLTRRPPAARRRGAARRSWHLECAARRMFRT